MRVSSARTNSVGVYLWSDIIRTFCWWPEASLEGPDALAESLAQGFRSNRWGLICTEAVARSRASVVQSGDDACVETWQVCG